MKTRSIEPIPAFRNGMTTTYFFLGPIGLKVKLVIDERHPGRGTISYHGEPSPAASQADFEHAYLDILYWIFLVETERFEQIGIPELQVLLEDENQQLEFNFDLYAEFHNAAIERLKAEKYCPVKGTG